MNCPKCNKLISIENALFCPFCGQDLTPKPVHKTLFFARPGALHVPMIQIYDAAIIIINPLDSLDGGAGFNTTQVGARLYLEALVEAVSGKHGKVYAAKDVGEECWGFNDVIFVVDDPTQSLSTNIVQALEIAKNNGYTNVVLPLKMSRTLKPPVGRNYQDTVNNIISAFKCFQNKSDLSVYLLIEDYVHFSTQKPEGCDGLFQ